MRTRVTLLLLLPALALAACGGGSDEDKIKDIINDGTKDATTICENGNENFLKQVGGSLEDCKKAAAEAEKTDNDDPVKDLKIEIDGDKATATFKDADGNNKISFVKQDGDWKVDHAETT